MSVKCVVRALASTGLRVGDKFWPGVDTDAEVSESDLVELKANKLLVVVVQWQGAAVAEVVAPLAPPSEAEETPEEIVSDWRSEKPKRRR